MPLVGRQLLLMNEFEADLARIRKLAEDGVEVLLQLQLLQAKILLEIYRLS